MIKADNEGYRFLLYAKDVLDSNRTTNSSSIVIICLWSILLPAKGNHLWLLVQEHETLQYKCNWKIHKFDNMSELCRLFWFESWGKFNLILIQWKFIPWIRDNYDGKIYLASRTNIIKYKKGGPWTSSI